MAESNEFGEMVELLNQEIKETGQLKADKDFIGWQFNCGVCGNVGEVSKSGMGGAKAHDGERPECYLCGFRGIKLYKFKPKKEDCCTICKTKLVDNLEGEMVCPTCDVCSYCDRDPCICEN
ncbi:hypothetical protein KAU43_03655 [candidate division WOR-3 bacterium]|nr:hypothetical protein [candidate division WOR-3 bacterium]